jgi:hypothetical protein
MIKMVVMYNLNNLQHEARRHFREEEEGISES